MKALRDLMSEGRMAWAPDAHGWIAQPGDIVDALGLGDFFVRVYGGNSFHTKKPDPLGVHTLLEETGTRSDETAIIGDSSIDVITGRNAELWTCGVTYGFAPRTLDDAPPDVLVDSARELADVFG